MASNPSSRLNGIFQDATTSGGGNDALRYTAPKEPSVKQSPVSQTAAPTPTPSTTSTVVYSTMVSLYQYDTTVRKYVQLGGTTTGTKATVGCVIVGAETTYNLLFYNAAKHHLCTVPIKFGSFKPTLQAKSYVNFYDDQGVNWSVKFAADSQVAEFMRQVFLTKIHTEIWGPDKTVTKTNPSALIPDDLIFVKPEIPSVSNGDTVAVAFSAWRVVGNATSAPADVVTKYAPFEKANESDLRKLRLGDASERIKALEEGIVGMKKGGKRIVLAPPGKTNGQDWYLLEIELVKTKTGQTTQRKASVPAGQPDEARTGVEKKSRRHASSSNPATAFRSNSLRSGNDRLDNARNSDLVPYDEDANRNELEMKELRLLQREQQLELQARALERERMSGTSGYGSMGFGATSGLHNSFGGASPLFHPNTGRPADAILSELNAKVDYLIRMAPGTSTGGSGVGAGPSDVAAVIRGVERLASENDRLLTQINSQHQQQSSYEKRCEELLDQNQRLQQEKRELQERYQSAASSQLNTTSELSALASARDAAVTQTNRLHAEYQQLLTAYYQLQHQHGTGTEAEEHKQALTFEREARARAEKQLDNETQARLLAEQELVLTKKQHDVALQVKTSEVSTMTAHLEQQVRALQAQVQQVNDERMRLQVYVDEQTKLVAVQSEAQQLVAQLQREKHEWSDQLDASSARVRELETALAEMPAGGTSTETLAAEEKQNLVEQIALLQQTVHDLEQDKLEQVQQTLSPRGQRKGSESACANCAVVKEQEQAAERALTAAEAIKREAQDLLAVAAHTGGDERARLVALFKEAVNDMFFRFQDLFEEETAVDGKQVLHAIRKVLKSSTKSIVQQLQEPSPLSDADGDRRDGLAAQALVETNRRIDEPQTDDIIVREEEKTQFAGAEPLVESEASGFVADATQLLAASSDASDQEG